jgi:hypothetical protein
MGMRGNRVRFRIANLGRRSSGVGIEELMPALIHISADVAGMRSKSRTE